jgi:uncharacterized lipoprotein YajG
MTRNIMGMFAILIILSACGPIVKQVKVAYIPIGELPAAQSKSLGKIRVEPFIDKRVGDALGEIPGQYGSIGKYVAGTDVTKIITDAVKVELANQGYQIVEERNEDIILSGALLALNGQRRYGMATGRVEGSGQISVSLKDNRQGKIVWSDIINGKSEVSYGMFTNVHNKFEEAINLTITDLINKLTRSESLHGALR